jgi:hypothetical protein
MKDESSKVAAARKALADYEASATFKELKQTDLPVALLRNVALWVVIAGTLWGIAAVLA